MHIWGQAFANLIVAHVAALLTDQDQLLNVVKVLNKFVAARLLLNLEERDALGDIKTICHRYGHNP